MANKKNGGIIPPLPLGEDGKKDERVLYVPVGCGKCMECKKQKARQWKVRLFEEIKSDKTGIFVTLTFSNESIKQIIAGEDTRGIKVTEELKTEGYELDNEIATIATRRFLEKWRKKYKVSVKHWLTTELGKRGTENIHLHGIIWTENPEEIRNIWSYGFVRLSTDKYKGRKGYVNEKTINYITKYVTKIDEKHKYYEPKILTSAGIGKGYLTEINKKEHRYEEGKTKEEYKIHTGQKIQMPIYYRNYIYKDEEKERLWIEKLDKDERYINGIKVNKDKFDEEYYRLLEQQRAINRRLGYGDDKKNWDKVRYENERRNINYKKRRGL